VYIDGNDIETQFKLVLSYKCVKLVREDVPTNRDFTNCHPFLEEVTYLIEFHKILVSINAHYFKACQSVNLINSKMILEVPIKMEFQFLRFVASYMHFICERGDEE